MFVCEVCGKECKNKAGLAGYKQLKHRSGQSAQPLENRLGQSAEPLQNRLGQSAEPLQVSGFFEHQLIVTADGCHPGLEVA